MSKKRRIWPFILFLIIIGIFSVFFLKTSFTISKVVDWSTKNLPFIKEKPELPERDPDRINILLLGIRGLDDPGDGKLLSDAIVVISIKKSTGQIGMISIPRDLYVEIWDLWDKAKINSAYSYNGLDCSKKTISLMSGLYIDYGISVNFKAFEKIVDELGGVSVYLDKPFEESFQWTGEGWEESEYWFKKKVSTSTEEEHWVFHVPAGENTFDGKTALYYVRSRFSTNDFDRMRRQQQVLLALKKKIFSLGIIANPIKVYNLLDIVGENVRTDMGLGNIKEMIGLIGDLDTDNIETLVFDTSPQGLLYQTFVNNEYVLLPIGDNFDKIQEACKNIFN